MFDKFISYLKFEKRYSEHTLKAYERDLNDFLVYSDIKAINEFSAFSASYIRSWIVYLIENDYIRARKTNGEWEIMSLDEN